MKIIEIKTQAQFEKLPGNFKSYTLIKILGKDIIINRAWGNASVEAWDNASVIASDNASVEARDNASVEALGNASVRAWGNASVRAWDNASVRAWGNASVEAWDNASVKAFMNTIIRIFSDGVKILEARQQVVIVYQECEGKPGVYDDTVIINKTQKAKLNIRNFIGIYDVKERKNKLVLYKFVQENFTDFYTGKITYKVGQIIKCPDWDADENLECGGGLHLSPSIKDCKKFNDSKNGHALKCDVDIKDIIVHPNPLYPYKVRCRKVKVIEEIKE